MSDKATGGSSLLWWISKYPTSSLPQNGQMEPMSFWRFAPTFASWEIFDFFYHRITVIVAYRGVRPFQSLTMSLMNFILCHFSE